MTGTHRLAPLLLSAALFALPALASAQTTTTTPSMPAPATTATPGLTTTTTAPSTGSRKAHQAKAAQPLPTSTVHINSAAVADLLKLPGVTAAVADNIVKNRPYKTADELVKKVKGIGPKNVKKILPYIDFQ